MWGYRLPVLRPRRLPLAGAVLVLAAATTACSSAQPGSGTPAMAVQAAGAQDPVQLIAQAQHGLDEALAYHVSGTILLGGAGASVDLTVQFGGGHGRVTTPDGLTATLDYVASYPPPGASGLYVTANAAYWEKQGQTAADAARFAGRQVSVPTSHPLVSLVTLVHQKALTRLVFTTAGPTSSPSVHASPDVDGRKVWVVDYGGERGARLTVMTDGQQFPLRLASRDATLTFDRFGKEPKIESPATISLSLPR
jgi:hypothetical protein